MRSDILVENKRRIDEDGDYDLLGPFVKL